MWLKRRQNEYRKEGADFYEENVRWLAAWFRGHVVMNEGSRFNPSSVMGFLFNGELFHGRYELFVGLLLYLFCTALSYLLP